MTYRTKIIALSAAVVLLSIHAVAFTDISGVIAQGQDRMPLLAEIVNSDEDPVPVSLQGTGDVSGNVRAEQEGEWNVNSAQDGEWNVNSAQDGDWNVGIDPEANTVQVDQGAVAQREIFQGMIQMNWGEDDLSVDETFQVPAGKLLVIEQISAHAITDDNMDFLLFSAAPFTTGGPFLDHGDETNLYRLPLEKGDTGRGRYVGSEQTTIYIDGGQTVRIHASRDGTGIGDLVRVNIIGYLADK